MNILPTNPYHRIAPITASETQARVALPVNQGSLVGRSGIVLTFAIVLLAALTLLPSSKGWADRSVLEVPVIASYPVYQTVVRQEPREQCHIQQVAKSSTKGQSAIPAILSTIIGGALGNAVGSKKSNQRVGAVAGGVLGYSIGKDVGRRHAQRHGDVRPGQGGARARRHGQRPLGPSCTAASAPRARGPLKDSGTTRRCLSRPAAGPSSFTRTG